MPKKALYITSFSLLLGTCIFTAIYLKFNLDIALSLAITLGTTGYHFIMRQLVGGTYNLIMKNNANYSKRWYYVNEWENKIYKKLGVKQWKQYIPTYAPDSFNPKLHSWEEIVKAMCQAELVHETIMLLSFLPIIMTVWFNTFWVFFITSLVAALAEMIFVIVQRFNRSRIIKMMKK